MPDDSTTAGIPSESESDTIGRVEETVLSRRELLAGLGIGGVGGAGAVFGLARSGEGFQSLATLAGGAVLPASVRYYLPAVDASDGGLIVPIEFEFSEGNGELFVDLAGVEVRHDLQLALREARETATRLADGTLAETTTRVTFEPPNADILALRGKSWEAGLTVALVASLRQQSLPRETLITGIVDDEGTLLPVGGIEGKARAARTFGARELLVPEGDTSDVAIQGIRVIEVASITYALDRLQ